MTSPGIEQTNHELQPVRPASNGRSARSARPKSPEDFSTETMRQTLQELEQELRERFPQADLTNVEAAFDFALEAASHNPGATLYLLHVIPEPEVQFWKTYI